MPREHILMSDPDWQPTPVAELVFEPATPPPTDAAPTTWALPPEPGPEVTELRGRSGLRWRRYPAGWSNGVRHAIQWSYLLATDAPLSTVPPEQTEASS